MDEQRLNEIRERLDGAIPTHLEPAFKDEVWFIRHLEEVITAYRQDVPDLLEALRAAEQRAAEVELESQLILTSLGNRDADVNELENRLEAVEADAADERERFAKVEADNYAYLQELKARAAEAEAHLNGIVGAVGWLETFVFEINMDGETDYERCIIDLLKKHEAAAAWLEAGEGKE